MKALYISSFIFLYMGSTMASVKRLNNSIVPVDLGNTKIILGKHTFVSYINISHFLELKNNLKDQVNIIAKNCNLTMMSNELIGQAWSLIYQIDNSLRAIQPNVRRKRNLNLIDAENKWSFGFLDHENGEKVNTVVNYLHKSDNLSPENITREISLATEFILDTNQCLNQTRQNIVHTKEFIDRYPENINSIYVLNLIINSLINLENSLSQTINGIMFAKLNKVHPSLLSLKNLDCMMKKMSSLYSTDQLAYFEDIRNYYTFLGIQFILHKDKVIFLTHFPILDHTTFKSYLVYPVPIQNRIIIPPKLFLTLNGAKGQFQYEKEACSNIESTYFCKNRLKFNEDCIVSLITKNETNKCRSVLVHMKNGMSSQITADKVLFTTPTTASVIEVCPSNIKKIYKLHPGSYLIFIPRNCHAIIGTDKFYTLQEHPTTVTVVDLPPLNISLLREYKFSFNLTSINLKEIEEIAEAVNLQNKLDFLESKEYARGRENESILANREESKEKSSIYHPSFSLFLFLLTLTCTIISLLACCGVLVKLHFSELVFLRNKNRATPFNSSYSDTGYEEIKYDYRSIKYDHLTYT